MSWDEHVPERCSGDHRVQRIVHVRDDDPTPPWPEEDNRCERCACGAELEFLTIVHRHSPADRLEPSVVH